MIQSPLQVQDLSEDSNRGYLNEDELELRLKHNVQLLISRQFYEFRKKIKDKNFDPASLINRIKLQ